MCAVEGKGVCVPGIAGGHTLATTTTGQREELPPVRMITNNHDDDDDADDDDDDDDAEKTHYMENLLVCQIFLRYESERD